MSAPGRRGPARDDEALRPEIVAHAQRIWRYLRLGEPLAPAEVLVVFGSSDPRVAEHAGAIWTETLAPLVVCTGARGPLTADWPRTEAETFAEILVERGVPPERVVIEDESTNTGENLRLTIAALGARGLSPRSWLLVHRPFLERRVRATFRAQRPEDRATITSPPFELLEYATPEQPLPMLLERLVGTVDRILHYPARGFQAPEPVPDDVRASWRVLVEAGFTADRVA